MTEATTEEKPVCESLEEIVERIMTAHWDIFACNCWVCRSARQFGLAPQDEYLQHKNDNRKNFPCQLNLK